MGKGDRKTKRGKITKGTFGVRRPHKKRLVIESVSKKKASKAATKKPRKTATRKKKEE